MITHTPSSSFPSHLTLDSISRITPLTMPVAGKKATRRSAVVMELVSIEKTYTDPSHVDLTELTRSLLKIKEVAIKINDRRKGDGRRQLVKDIEDRFGGQVS